MSFIRKFRQMTLIGFREASVYRFNAAVGIGTSMLFLLLYYSIWKSIAASGQLNTSLEQVMIYIVLGQVAYNALFMGPEGYVGDLIRKGTVVNELKRPVSFRLQVYCHEIGWSAFRTAVRAVPVFLIGVLFFKVSIPPVDVFTAYLFSMLLSFNLIFSMAFMTSMLVFWTKVAWSIRAARNLLTNLFSGVMFPLYLLPEWLKPVFYSLPFQGMVDAPISIFTMRATGSEVFLVLGKQLAWTVVLLLLGELMWRKAQTKLTVQGG